MVPGCGTVDDMLHARVAIGLAGLMAGCSSIPGNDDPSTTTSADGSSTTEPPTTSLDTTGTAAGTTGSTAAVTSAVTTTSSSTSSSSSAANDESSTGATGLCAGSFPRAWNDGTNCPEDDVQVHRYSENTFILRQSLCTGFEGPFLYLLFGEDRVLLEDTGYNGVQVAPVVNAVIEGWLEEQGRTSIDLIVANSHAHGDHVGGNGQFVGRPDTTVVGFGVADMQAFFGIDNWREDIVQYDLGGRVLDVIPIPGHQTSHVAFFDRDEGLLLTGDTLYPGRLYVADFPTFVSSIERLVNHVGDAEVCDVLGTHIEMTSTPGVDFRFGAPSHPDERELGLDLSHVLELRDAVVAMGNAPEYEVHDDFIIVPL